MVERNEYARSCFSNHYRLGCGICGEMYNTSSAAKSCFYRHLINSSNDQNKLENSQKCESVELEGVLRSSSPLDDGKQLTQSNSYVGSSVHTHPSQCSQFEIIDNNNGVFLGAGTIAASKATNKDLEYLLEEDPPQDKHGDRKPTKDDCENADVNLVDSANGTVRMSRLTLCTKGEVQRSPLYEETKPYYSSQRYEISDSLNSERCKQMSITHVNRLNPVVYLIKDQCSNCKRVFARNHSEMHLARHVHVCKMAADEHIAGSDQEIESPDKITENTSGKMNVPTCDMQDNFEKKFACTLCSYRCNWSSGLSSHMRIHTGEKPFACTQCSFRCSQGSTLSAHTRTHTGEKPFACTLCSYRSYQGGNLSTHMLSHTGEKPLVCKFCPYRCRYSSRLAKHMRIHTDEKPFSCSLCSYSCRLSSALSKHMRSHTCPFACTVCPYRCRKSSTLSSHMRSHTVEKPFACTLCSYQCSDGSTLAGHMRSHSDEKPFACAICSFRCRHKSNLRNHMRIHGEKRFLCPICSHQCNENGALVLHMRSHTGEKPFSCSQCSYRSARSEGLTIHMLSHTGEKPFACPICSNRFREKKKLNRHLRNHTGEKPFACTLCSYRCSENSRLSKHVRSSHFGEKPVACTLCPSRFTNNSHLSKHMRSHTDEK